jgi:hypothetical protein
LIVVQKEKKLTSLGSPGVRLPSLNTSWTVGSSPASMRAHVSYLLFVSISIDGVSVVPSLRRHRQFGGTGQDSSDHLHAKA